MQKIDFYQVDAFADALFQGNPAGVCIIEKPLPKELMQQIAAENNLSETAFVLPGDNYCDIRYFSPKAEVDLCGHATLASAFVLANFVHKGSLFFTFETQRSGQLTIEKRGDVLALNLPVDTLEEIDGVEIERFGKVLGVQPLGVLSGRTDFLAFFENESQVSALLPVFSDIAQWNARGIIATAPGTDVDFVSRFFAPAIGIDEDPVTGSAHTSLVPFWHGKTGKDVFVARQLSSRGGMLYCRYLNHRIEVAGKAVLYLHGSISI